MLGLVHGFGLAGALHEFGLPHGALVPALAGFNIGVEIGLVVIVVVIFPLLLWFDQIGGRNSVHKGRHPGGGVELFGGDLRVRSLLACGARNVRVRSHGCYHVAVARKSCPGR